MDFIPAAIEAYAKAHSSSEDPLLQELCRDTQENVQWPQMQTGHLEGSLLRLLAKISGAKRVLEIGTFTGYSSLSLASGMSDDGKVITCDVDPVATEMAKRYWARSPHGKKIELRMGPALETIETIEEELDLVFIDADKENYSNYWEACVPKVRSGGLILVDNVLWYGKVLDPKEESDLAIVAFNELAQADERVDLVMLTVRDGVSLAVKR